MVVRPGGINGEAGCGVPKSSVMLVDMLPSELSRTIGEVRRGGEFADVMIVQACETYFPGRLRCCVT